MNPVKPSLPPLDSTPSRAYTSANAQSYTDNWLATMSFILALVALVAVAFLAFADVIKLGATGMPWWIFGVALLIVPVCAIGAIVTGALALGRSYLYPPGHGHRGLAKAGQTLGLIELVILVCGVYALYQFGCGMSYTGCS